MRADDAPDLDAAFAALADPTRRAILVRLMTGEATVQEMARPFAISQPAISRHLRVLEEAGLIETRVDGSARPRRLKAETVERIWDWLGQYRALWEARYNRLDGVLAQMDLPVAVPADAPQTPTTPEE
jgi:DNA-binding transcriptional ArsR family regulator